MIDPISLTVAGVGAGGTWTAAYAWAKRDGKSHSDAVKHACKVTGKVTKKVGLVVLAGGDIGGIIDSVFNN